MASNEITRQIKIGLSKADKTAMRNDIANELNENLENFKTDIDETIQGLGTLRPSGTSVESEILSFTENKGIYIATDTGHWYYFDELTNSYTDGGVYQAVEIEDGAVTEEKLGEDVIERFENIEKDVVLTNAKVEGNSRQIKNLQLASEGKLFTTEADTSIAYVKDVPSGTLPYAYLSKVGGMNHKSKNLFDINKLTNFGGSIDYTNKTITISQYGANQTLQTLQESCPNLKAGDTLYINANVSLAEAEKQIYIVNTKKVVKFNTGVAITQEDLDSTFYFYANSLNTSQSNTLSNIMFSKEPITEYEDYFEGIRDTKVTNVKSVGANILDTSNAIDTFTRNGVTFTKLSDGGFNVVGTSSNSSYSILSSDGWTNREEFMLPPGTYTIGFFGNLNEDVVRVALSWDNYSVTFVSYYNIPRSFTLDTQKKVDIYITVPNGQTANNIIYPYLVRGEVALTEFEPYQEENIAIPSEIQALDGYGLGINEEYNNHIDYDRKVFVKNSYKLTLTNDMDIKIVDTNANYISVKFTSHLVSFCNKNYNYAKDVISTFTEQTDNDLIVISSEYNVLYWYIPTSKQSITGTTVEEIKAYLSGNPIEVIYPLKTPIETDISEYLTHDGFVKVEKGGTITFESEHSMKTNSEVVYQIKVGEE